MALSVSPYDVPIVNVFSLLLRLSLTPLLLLSRQCLVSASPALCDNLPTMPIVGHTYRSSPSPQATSPLLPVPRLSFPCSNVDCICLA
ncbi:hypothetical protein BHE74_00054368 [Ensete ventricosum]|nr:hypothetical protein BHE74_00054368 [Ensete ventricosum]RZR98880.1 hypothetical protein BHM03_00028337 [Ensete ventricosum]